MLIISEHFFRLMHFVLIICWHFLSHFVLVVDLFNNVINLQIKKDVSNLSLMMWIVTLCIYLNCRWVQAVALEVSNFLRMQRTCLPLVSTEPSMALEIWGKKVTLRVFYFAINFLTNDAYNSSCSDFKGPVSEHHDEVHCGKLLV